MQQAGSTTSRRVPEIITADGVLVPLSETLPPISADAAGELLPEIRALLARIRRLEGYLTEVLKSDMRQRGQRERRVGDLLYELKPDAEWTVTDPHALSGILETAELAGDITPLEHARARQVVSLTKWNHSVLNNLAKRLPAIDEYRKRSESEPVLRVK